MTGPADGDGAGAAPPRGKLFLVGFGPGSRDHITFRAREAIGDAEVVIGYRTYVHLVKDLLAGKKLIYTGMTEELDRARKAVDLAFEGRRVALISSGDVGIYGMAGPAFEVLKERGWRPGGGIDVEVVPGVTALSACASVLGAPLVHDFCAISLSDLLTPWEVIAKRLDAAAAADFVIALYNPRSGRRTRQIIEAQKILLKHRLPATPVGIVKSCKRDLENVVVTDLQDMLRHEIGMLTTILVGNSRTFRHHDLLVTPRGYQTKYDLGSLSGTGVAIDRVEGAAPARSLPTAGRLRPSGALYGIGVGPGDPELLTLKARRILSTVPHLFYPRGSSTDESFALTIVEGHVRKDADVGELYFPMTKDRAALEAAWQEAAQKIAEPLARGEDVAFVTIGDPMTFSTWIYLADAVRRRMPDVEVQTVPGVTSFQAAAALADAALGEGKGRLAIVGVNRDVSNVEDALDRFETVVLLKVGSKLPRVLEILEARGMLDHAVLLSYIGTADQEIVTDLRPLKRQTRGYMSLMIVKRNRVFSARDALAAAPASGELLVEDDDAEPERRRLCGARRRETAAASPSVPVSPDP